MLKIAKKNNNPSIDNVITRICNVVFATLPCNLFSPIDSHILDFEFFSENHNFILIKQIIVSYTKIRLHYFNKQFNKNLKGKFVRQLFCSTLSEFENFLLRERILINVTTCQNETSR
jgi:hypothetical protein